MYGLRGRSSVRLASKKYREAPFVSPAICRTVNSERVACMARRSCRMEMALGRMQRAEEETSTESRESKLNSRTVGPSYSGEGIPNRGLAASRGINRSLTDSSLRFLTYNRRRELWDF